MVREDILEGLKLAVSKGESLKHAMISFYNAGYTRAEIQEAAQALQQGHTVQTAQPQVQQPAAQTQPTTQEQQVIQEQKPLEPKEKLKSAKQVVSKYGKKKKKAGTALVIILAVFLALLIGVVVLLIIFKDQLTNLLNNLI